MGHLTILYGTQTGVAQTISFRIARCALHYGFDSISILPADEVPLEKWPHSSPIILVCSNASQGSAPQTIRQSWAQLLRQNVASKPMHGLSFAVFGVGDSLYPKFNYMGKMLHNRLVQLGGTPLINRGLGDESDPKGLEEVLLPWLSRLLRELRQLPNAQTEVPLREDEIIKLTTIPFAPLYRVVRMEEASGEGANSSQKLALSSELDLNVPREEPMQFFSVSCNTRITTQDHFQIVHHLVFEKEKDAPSLYYEPGDALGIYPPNDPALVETFLERIKRTGNELITIYPNEAIYRHQRRQPFFGRTMSLRLFVSHYLDLEAVVSQDFLGMLSNYVEDLEKKERLLELMDYQFYVEFLDYSHREKRNVCEVLQDFTPSEEIPIDMLLSYAPSMRPRLYSISSSLEKDGTDSLHITVAKLEWQTPLKRQRKGTCSTFIINSTEGTKIPCYIWQGTLFPPDATAPMICIGTGTGVAPLRSLIRQRYAAGTQTSYPATYLFFGCRYADKDFLYKEEWEEFRSDKKETFSLIPAFSRHGDKKYYVQNALGDYALLVGRLLDAGAFVYICGSATQMPKDVIQTIEDIAKATFCEGDDAAAKQFMKVLQREGRLQVDTWSS